MISTDRFVGASRHAPIALGLVCALSAAMFAWVIVEHAAAVDPRMRQCGSASGGRVVAAFELAEARDYRRYFPNAPTLPELEADASPAFVIVRSGQLRIRSIGRAEREAGNAVCVLVGDVANIYTDLDISGFQP